MTETKPFDAERDLEQLTELINAHIGAWVPGWSLPAEYVAARLLRDPDEYIVDSWVVERETLVGYEDGRLCAAAHLHHYGEATPAAGRWDINQFLFWPENREAGEALLAEVCRKLAERGAGEVILLANLWMPAVAARVPDCWPHVLEVVEQAGFRAEPGSVEYIYAGPVPDEPPPAPPLTGLTYTRSLGAFGTRFAAVYDGVEIAECECVTHRSKGGRLPCLHGWADLMEVETQAEWRNRSVGSWLMAQANAWLRLGGFTHVIFSVGEENHAAGAGRFYERFGWRSPARVQGAHRRVLVPVTRS